MGKLLIEQVPIIGLLVSIGDWLVSTSQAKFERLSKADSLLSFLEHYIIATFQWCVVIQSFSDSLASFGKETIPVIDETIEKVSTKLEKIIQEMIAKDQEYPTDIH